MLRALLTNTYAADVCGRMLTRADADRLLLVRALRPPAALRSLLMQVGARGMRVGMPLWEAAQSERLVCCAAYADV
jgi:hypothetical protein